MHNNVAKLLVCIMKSVTALMLVSVPSVYAAEDKTLNAVSYGHVLNWVLGLIMVLCLFFACAWLVKKTGALSINARSNLKVIAGVSLGMREKLILVQVGDKQLVLGVTPGRIDNLLVLEGDEQLFKDAQDKQLENDFSSKLKQMMSGSKNE